MAAAHNSTPATVALAWLIARPSVTAPIVSATNPAQLDELLRAAALVLGNDAVDLLNTASA